MRISDWIQTCALPIYAILDGMAGLWCVQVGYGRKELADAAYDQMLELPYYNTFFKTATPPTIQLASKISELLGGNLSHVFFNTSGSEAIDTIIRLARFYWQAEGEPERTIVIAREKAQDRKRVVRGKRLSDH